MILLSECSEPSFFTSILRIPHQFHISFHEFHINSTFHREGTTETFEELAFVKKNSEIWAFFELFWAFESRAPNKTHQKAQFSEWANFELILSFFPFLSFFEPFWAFFELLFSAVRSEEGRDIPSLLKVQKNKRNGDDEQKEAAAEAAKAPS